MAGMSLFIPVAVAFAAIAVIATKKSPAVANADEPAHPPVDGGAPPQPAPKPPTSGTGLNLGADASSDPWYEQDPTGDWVLTSVGQAEWLKKVSELRGEPYDIAKGLDAWDFRGYSSKGVKYSEWSRHSRSGGFMIAASAAWLDLLKSGAWTPDYGLVVVRGTYANLKSLPTDPPYVIVDA